MIPLALVAAIEFLAEHKELLAALVEALDGGASKEALVRAIRAEMIAASDAAMQRELGGA